MPQTPGATIATLDVGSNGIHLLVARIDDDGRVWPREKLSRYVRLGSETLIEGRLSPAAFERGLRIIGQLRNVAKRHSPSLWSCVATSAIREAENGQEFLQAIRDNLGLNVREISEEEEGRLIYAATAAGLGYRADRMVVVDVGGGSTNLVLGNNRRALLTGAIRVGSLRLREQWDLDDPAPAELVSVMADWVKTASASIVSHYREAGFSSVVFTSGSALTLARAVGRPLPTVGHDSHYFLPLDALAAFEEEIARLPVKARKAYRHLDKDDRAASIVESAVIVRTIMQSLGVDGAMVATSALRDGLALDIANTMRRPVPALRHVEEEGFILL